ncbi:MAG: aldose 1-epimerase family protein [Propionibacteriaceae bacterium]
MSSTPRSGQQFTLTAGGYVAEIASVGASLRTLRHAERDLVVPFDADEVRPGYRGATLAPWPNRVVDGRYVDDDGLHQLALTEPDRGHALHGLVCWQDFVPIGEVSAEHVALTATIVPQQGYPHRVEVTVDFTLGADGLSTTVTGTHLGPGRAPWGTGPHPYLVGGPGLVDDWTLELPAATVLTVTPDRLVPLDLLDVTLAEGGRWDFRSPRRIGDTFLDHAFTDLLRVGGQSSVRVGDGTGTGVVITFDTACPWVQVHTADLPDPTLSRRGLAVEPMTCAPDAFTSGRGLVRLGPGEAHTAGWRIAAR